MTKHRLLLVILFAAITWGPAQAAAEPTTVKESAAPQKTHGIYFDPLAVAFGSFGLGYEHVLGKYLSLQVGASYSNPWNSDDIWVVGGEIRAFVFPFGRAPGGLYIAPLFRAAYVRGETESSAGGGSATVTGNAFGWGAGGTVGWSWILGPVAIRAGLGGLYRDIEAEATDGTNTLTMGSKGPALTADLAFGFVF